MGSDFEKHTLLREMEANADAYDRMFIEYYPPLCAYASQYVSHADAEELVQDVMLQIWNRREYLTVDKSLKTYLFVCVKNKCYDFIRNRRTRARIHSAIFEKLRPEIDNPDYYTTNELADNIEKAIRELPETYRETFEMSRFGNIPNSEIAEKLNLSVKTVEYRITQALKILRLALKDYLSA